VTKQLFKRLLADRSGATAIEYGLILALVVLAMIGALSAFAGESELTWNTVAQKTHDAISGSAS
jgi:pilus assembly protein Flp/PilA